MWCSRRGGHPLRLLPYLVIHGEADPLVRPAASRALTSAIPGDDRAASGSHPGITRPELEGYDYAGSWFYLGSMRWWCRRG